MVQHALNPFVNRLLAMAVEAKYHHWNFRGPEFFYMHEKYDDLHSDLNSYADLIAERIRAENSVNFIEMDVALVAPAMAMSHNDCVTNTAIDLNDLTQDLSVAILNERDAATQDTLVEIQRGVDKWLWMFTSSR